MVKIPSVIFHGKGLHLGKSNFGEVQIQRKIFLGGRKMLGILHTTHNKQDLDVTNSSLEYSLQK